MLSLSLTIPSSAKGSDANGFYNIEYPLPANLITDSNGNVKTKFVVRLTASPNTLCPGIYYVRLLKDYQEETYQAYRFVANQWTTGDPNRVSASNITYDMDNNIIHVKASGNNNVALMLKYQDLDYTITSDQIYLVVRGTNLSTANGASYLWWLNGSNHGTQVAPTKVIPVTVNGIAQTVVAWDMTKSGIYENFTGDHPSVCVGQTIFGLTSTTGQSDIYDINFVSNPDDYASNTVGIRTYTPSAQRYPAEAYSINGMKWNGDKGIVVSNGKKYVHTK